MCLNLGLCHGRRRRVSLTWAFRKSRVRSLRRVGHTRWRLITRRSWIVRCRFCLTPVLCAVAPLATRLRCCLRPRRMENFVCASTIVCSMRKLSVIVSRRPRRRTLLPRLVVPSFSLRLTCTAVFISFVSRRRMCTRRRLLLRLASMSLSRRRLASQVSLVLFNASCSLCWRSTLRLAIAASTAMILLFFLRRMTRSFIWNMWKPCCARYGSTAYWLRAPSASSCGGRRSFWVFWSVVPVCARYLPRSRRSCRSRFPTPFLSCDPSLVCATSFELIFLRSQRCRLR